VHGVFAKNKWPYQIIVMAFEPIKTNEKVLKGPISKKDTARWLLATNCIIIFQSSREERNNDCRFPS